VASFLEIWKVNSRGNSRGQHYFVFADPVNEKQLLCFPFGATLSIASLSTSTVQGSKAQSHCGFKFQLLIRHWCLTPVILATQEAEIRRIAVQSQPRQIVRKTLL
jgi:hypothetical protein